MYLVKLKIVDLIESYCYNCRVWILTFKGGVLMRVVAVWCNAVRIIIAANVSWSLPVATV